MSDRIALVGLRGTGKTTVGRLLAAELGWTFADTDAAVEAEASRTVAELFRAEGEDGFRFREAVVVLRLAAADRQVLATGGGAVLAPVNRLALGRCGLVAWLTAPPAVLWERTQADPATAARRPDLTAAGGLAEVERLLGERESLYREVATHAFDTADRSPAEVAAAILREWRARARGERGA